MDLKTELANFQPMKLLEDTEFEYSLNDIKDMMDLVYDVLEKKPKGN